MTRPVHPTSINASMMIVCQQLRSFADSECRGVNNHTVGAVEFVVGPTTAHRGAMGGWQLGANL